MGIFKSSKLESEKEQLLEEMSIKQLELEQKVEQLELKVNGLNKRIDSLLDMITLIRTDFKSINRIAKGTISVERIENKEIKKLKKDVQELRKMIQDPKRREVIITRDKELVKLRKEFDQFKKEALTVAD